MGTTGNPKRILIVDDEHDVRLLLTKTFEARGYFVTSAKNGKEAIEKAQTFRPDVILLDVVLPDMNGGNVAEILAEDPSTRRIPIVFLTALMTKTEEQERERHQAKHVMLAKPYDPNRLLDKIEEIVSLKSLAASWR